MKRRSKDYLEQLRADLWLVVTRTWYAQWDTCYRCGEHRYCASRNKARLLCRECHMKHASV